MAEAYDDILAAATGGASDQLKAPSDDPILKAAQGSPSSASAPPADPILAAAGATPSHVQEWKPVLLTDGLARNWAQMKAIPPSLQSMYEETQGNVAGAKQSATEAQNILKEAGDSEYELFKNVHSPIDFANWMTEKLGEQGITALATAGTGVGGAVGANLVARQLAARALIGENGVKTMMLAGSAIPTYALSSAMEAAGTSQEQFQVTGMPQAGLSATAGLSKGLLELWTPMSIARSLISPGTVLGKTIPGAIAKTMGKEGATEYVQELIDIAARKYSDPNYEFFGSGATPWYQGEGFLRAAESGATGAAVGAVYGAPFVGAEAKHARATALGTQPVGDRTTLPPEQAPPPTQPAGRVEPTFTSPSPAPEPLVLYRGAHKNDSLTGFVPKSAMQEVYKAGVFFTPHEEDAHEYTTMVRPLTYNEKGEPIPSPNATVLEYSLHRPIAENKAEYDPEKHAGFKMPGGREIVVFDRAALTPRNEQSKAALGRYRASNPVADPKFNRGPGPVSALRELVIPRNSAEDKISLEALNRNPRDDVGGIGALTSSVKEQAYAREAVANHVDATTPRYIERLPDGKLGTHVMTDTELELHTALNVPQSVKPQWVKVQHGSLQPAAISAHVLDLADPASNRVWFLPGTSAAVKQEALRTYAELHAHASQYAAAPLANAEARAQLEAAIKPAYGKLLSAGLRVVPSRGAGFYYNGIVATEGEPINPAQRLTKRTDQVAWYEPQTGVLKPFRGDESALNRDIEDPKTGVYVSVDMNKVNPADIVHEANGDFTIRQSPETLNKLTPGTVTMILRGNQDIVTVGWEASAEHTTRVYTADILFKNEQLAVEMTRDISAIVPIIKQILVGLGIRHEVPILLSDTYEGMNFSPALANLDQGIIVISPENWQKLALTNNGELKATLFNTVMHELGHLVAFHHFSNLPVEIQDGLNYAWEKALLAGRMGDYSKTQIIGDTTGLNISYWLSFPEFLAEQFRRWATSADLPTTWVEKHSKDVGQKLEKFFKEWEAKVSPKEAMNLRQPDHFFSATMEYLRNYGNEKERVSQLIKQMELMQVPQDILDSPAAFALAQQVITAVQSMAEMFPADMKIHLSDVLDPGIVPGEQRPASEGAGARWIYSLKKNLQLIEIALGAIGESTGELDTRVYVAHELFHAYEDLGLVTPQEIAILNKALKGKESVRFKRSTVDLQNQIQRVARDNKQSPEWASFMYQHMKAREARAYYVEEFANTGLAHDEPSRGVLSKIIQIIERIGNFIRGLGFQSRDDVLKAFFKGEMVARQDRAEMDMKIAEWAAQHPDLPALEARSLHEASQMEADKHLEVEPGVFMHINYFGGEIRNAMGRLYSKAVSYTFSQGNTLIGAAKLYHHGAKGYAVEGIQAQMSGRLQFAYSMLGHIAKDVGIPLRNQADPTDQLLKPPSEISKGAMNVYKLWGRKDPNADLLKYYVTLDRTGNYFSPNYIKKMLTYYQLEQIRQKNPAYESQYTKEQVAEKLKFYRELKAKVPEAAWSDPRLEQMFALKRNFERDEVQGSMLRSGQATDEAQLNQAMGFPAGPTTDGFSAKYREKQKQSQLENAERSGMAFDSAAPNSMLSYESRRIWERVTGYGDMDPAMRKDMRNLAHEMDRIGKFTKIWWSLDQLFWRNQHLVPLGRYRENIEQMKRMGAAWLGRADETAREWKKVTDPKRRDAIAQTLFFLTEMDYLSPAEKNAGIKRLPVMWQNFLAGQQIVPGSELDKLFMKAGLTAQDHAIIRRVQGDFAAFLNQVEQIRTAQLQSNHANSPQALAQGLASLQKEMAELRQKPYFPMVRFGEFTLVARDPADNNRVVWSNAYGMQTQRDAAYWELKKQQPGWDLSRSRVSSGAQEFMGLPGPLLRMIKEKLPTDIGLNAADKAKMQLWLEEFEQLNAPDRSFRKRWMPAKGIPGYSMDAFRAYSHYFMYGSRYLARLAYMDKLQTDVHAVRTSANDGNLGNAAKRSAIADYMANHYHYMMESGRDGGKFRALASLWFLGASPAAAAMNLTQPILTLWPKMTADFGHAQALYTFSQGYNAAKAQNGYAVGDARFMIAKAEMAAQGYIEVGQAAELGAFANGYNLTRLLNGDKIQQAYQWVQWAGMKMFSAAEHFNRQLTFKVAYDLALKNISAPAVQEIDRNSPVQRADLTQRVGLTYQEALAFLYAKEAIKKTQFEFGKDSDAPFMRGKLSKNFLIFFKYTHSMLYAMRFSGATGQMMLIMAFLYGLQGLPASDEINELLRMLARKLFGQDFDLQEKAREFVRDITRGTVFDRTGPDLFMHGVSRYGIPIPFGLLPEGWGAPSFDASANGSMGRLVPGLAEFLHGQNTDQKFNDMLAQSAQRAAGAGYGQMLGMISFMMAPNQVDSHKWESLLPRFMKGPAAAYRYGVNPQAETTSGGAKIVRFDPTNPDDLSTIAAQFMGFKPTKVNETWDVIRAQHEEKQVIAAKKSILYVQYNKAFQEKNPQAMEDVISGIRRFNDDMVAQNAPEQQIKTQDLRNTVKQRSTQKEMMEQFLATSKKDILATGRVLDRYPGVRIEKVK